MMMKIARKKGEQGDADGVYSLQQIGPWFVFKSMGVGRVHIFCIVLGEVLSAQGWLLVQPTHFAGTRHREAFCILIIDWEASVKEGAVCSGFVLSLALIEGWRLEGKAGSFCLDLESSIYLCINGNLI